MATGVETAASYGISEALLAAHPELRKVFDLFKAGNTGEALQALYATSYYQTTSSTVAAREKQRLEQPTVYADTVQKYKIAAQKRLVASGIQIDTATFDKLVNDAYAKGLDDNQLDQAILTSGKITGFGGNILGDTTSLKSYASDFGVEDLLNDAYWTSKQKGLFAGTITTEDIQKEIRNLSASAFPAYATGILNNVSLKSQASNIIQTVATYLEKDPSTVTFKDPTVRKIAQYIDPATKEPAAMPQWMVEKTVKSDPSWAFTKNAQNTTDNLFLKVAQDMGIM